MYEDLAEAQIIDNGIDYSRRVDLLDTSQGYLGSFEQCVVYRGAGGIRKIAGFFRQSATAVLIDLSLVFSCKNAIALGSAFPGDYLEHKDIVVFHQILLGKTDNQVSLALNISKRQVTTARENIKSKLGCVDVVSAVSVAFRTGLGFKVFDYLNEPYIDKSENKRHE